MHNISAAGFITPYALPVICTLQASRYTLLIISQGLSQPEYIKTYTFNAIKHHCYLIEGYVIPLGVIQGSLINSKLILPHK